MQITTFKPEKFWSINPYIIKDGYELLLDWERNKVFDFDVSLMVLLFPSTSNQLASAVAFFLLQIAAMFQKLVANDGNLKVIDISTKEECKPRPCGLNTVGMLKVMGVHNVFLLKPR